MSDQQKIKHLENNIEALKAQLEIMTKQVERWSQYKMALIEEALYVYEINVSKDSFIVKQPELYVDLELPYDCSYSAVVTKACSTKIRDEDAAMVFKSTIPQGLLDNYNKGKRQFSIEYRRNSNTENYEWTRFTAYMMQNQDSKDICALIIIKNINSQRTEELDLIDRARHDPLTKLYNRTSVETFVSTALTDKNAHHGLVILDIDNFKHLNDTHGHMFGDKVLIKFAFLLNAVFHRNDIIARIGGDEFIVFATNIQKDTLWLRAHEIIEGCVDFFPPQLLGLSITASIGIAMFPEHGTNFFELYPHADAALYQSKSAGKNRVTIFKEGMKPGLGKPTAQE